MAYLHRILFILFLVSFVGRTISGIRMRRTLLFPILQPYPQTNSKVYNHTTVIQGPLGSLTVSNSHAIPGGLNYKPKEPQLNSGSPIGNLNCSPANNVQSFTPQHSLLGVKLSLPSLLHQQNSVVSTTVHSSADCTPNLGTQSSEKFANTESSTTPFIPHKYPAVNPSTSPPTNANPNNVDSVIEDIFGNPINGETNNNGNVQPNILKNEQNINLTDHEQTGEGVIDVRNGK